MCEQVGAGSVFFFAFNMLSTVEFYREFCFFAVKVEHKPFTTGFDGVLAAELGIVYASVAQQSPHKLLGIGLLSAELSCQFNQILGQQFFLQGLALTPCPSPAGRGERKIFF
ncbi:MAG: hypothetical protein A2140_03910 [Candidatus Muproteobacteria bacterium RBG_16_62_13]|uniref:Uncharacterized protein n=1 Tax=Candidatus Muproteobacteria bacterium RBG_16_62_13 TaxID=1817756 RepID=A0A1F6T1D1_9PROT|nr:MAG: hypothetical protein A2140_03910 [Candidatus Muproteobacteria bacterium RBG_16_62_13]